MLSIKLFVFLFIYLTTSYSAKIFIDPTSSCVKNCIGNLTQPYNGLWAALQELSQTTSELIIINSPLSYNFLMYKQLVGSDTLETFPNLAILDQILTIRPLFCSDSEATGNMASRCLGPSDTLTIYLKNEDISLKIRNRINVTNIIFDGSESIEIYNQNSLSIISACTLNQTLCCGMNMKQGVNCFLLNQTIQKNSSRQGLFLIENGGSLTLSNSIIRNLNFVTASTCIKILNLGSLDLKNVSFQNFYFPDGAIVIQNISQAVKAINLDTVFATNFNPLGLVNSEANSVGFLNARYGNNSWITLKNCRFLNFELPVSASLLEVTSSFLSLNQSIFENITISRGNLLLATSSFLSMNSLIFTSLKLNTASILSALQNSTTTTQINNITLKTCKAVPQSFANFFVISAGRCNIQDVTFSQNEFDGSTAQIVGLGLRNTQVDSLSNIQFLENKIRSQFIAIDLPINIPEIRDVGVLRNNIIVENPSLINIFNMGCTDIALSGFKFQGNIMNQIFAAAFVFGNNRFQLLDSEISDNFLLENSITENTLALVHVASTGSEFIITNLMLLNNVFNGQYKILYAPDQSKLNFQNIYAMNNTLQGASYPGIFLQLGRSSLAAFSNISILNHTLTNNHKIFNFDDNVGAAFNGFQFSNNTVLSSKNYFMLISTTNRTQIVLQNLKVISNFFSGTIISPITLFQFSVVSGQINVFGSQIMQNKIYDNFMGFNLQGISFALSTTVIANNQLFFSTANPYLILGSNIAMASNNNTYADNKLMNTCYLKNLYSSKISLSYDLYLNNTLQGDDTSSYGLYFVLTDFYMKNTQFILNTVVLNGVFMGLYQGGDLSITSVKFLGNNVTSPIFNSAFTVLIGGGINLKAFTNVTINDNYLFSIYGTASIFTFRFFSVENIEVVAKNNTVIQLSGFILFGYLANILTFQNSLFENNTVLDGAALVLAGACNIRFTNTIFRKNRLFTPQGFPSNMISAYNGGPLQTNLRNVVFQDNYMEAFSTMFFFLGISTAFNMDMNANTFSKQSNAWYMTPGANLYVSDSNIHDNVLKDDSTFILGFQDIITVNMTIFKNNTLFDTSAHFQISSFSTCLFNRLVFIQNNKSLTPDMDNEIYLYTISFVDSQLDFTNSYFDFNPGLILAFNSKINFLNLSISNSIALFGSRQIFYAFITQFTLNNLNIIDNPDIFGQSDSILILISGSCTMNSVNISNFKTKRSFLFDFSAADVSISDCIFSSTSSLTKPLIHAFSSSLFSISNVKFESTLSMFSCQNMDSVKIENITFASETNIYYNPIYISNSSVIEVKNFYFEYKSFEDYQVVDSIITIYHVGTSISLKNCSFIKSYNRNGAITMKIPQGDIQVSITDTNFYNHIGSQAGALSILQCTSCQVEISNCKFISNTASLAEGQGGKGGAIYIDNQPPDSSSVITITNTSFIRNTADLNGGAIFVNGLKPNVDESNIFQENLVNGHENNISSQPIKLILMRDDVLLTDPNQLFFFPILGTLTNIGSGVTIPGKIKGVLLDHYNQIAVHDSDSSLSFKTEEKIFSSSIPSIKAIQGRYYLNNLIFIYGPGKNTSIQVRTDGIVQYTSIPETSNLEYILKLQFRNCLHGEVLRTDGSCNPCLQEFATFDFSLNSQSPCRKCNAESMICLGGGTVGSNRGYFQLNYTGDIFTPCRPGGNCLGSYVNSTMHNYTLCYPGYSGNLCNVCDGDASKDTYGVCRKCSENSQQYTLLCVGIVFNLFLILSGTNNLVKRSADSKNKSKQYKPDESAYFKVILTKNLVNYLQYANLIGNIQVSWPQLMVLTNQAGQYLAISSPQIFSLPCLYPKNITRPVFIDLFVTTMSPVVFFVFFTTVFLIHCLIKGKNIFTNKHLRNKIFVVCSVIFSNFQTPVLTANIQMFQCINLYRTDNKEMYLIGDYDLKCWDEEHRIWAMYFSLPIIVLWGLIIPMFYLFKIYKFRNVLHREDVVMKYSFFYQGRKKNRFYWDFITMMRKYLLMPVIVFGGQYNIGIQITITIYLVMIFYLTETSNNPYFNPLLNKVEAYSLRAICFISYSALFFYLVDVTKAFEIIFLILPSFFTLYYVLIWIVIYVMELVQNIRGTLKEKPKLLNRLRSNRIVSKLLSLNELKDSMEFYQDKSGPSNPSVQAKQHSKDPSKEPSAVVSSNRDSMRSINIIPFEAISTDLEFKKSGLVQSKENSHVVQLDDLNVIFENSLDEEIHENNEMEKTPDIYDWSTPSSLQNTSRRLNKST